MLEDGNVTYVKGKVASIAEDPGSKDLILDVEDTLGHETLHPRFDMVVLATGIVPNSADIRFPTDLHFDEYGFLHADTGADGVFGSGCARGPCDVTRTTRDSTAAALKAIQCLTRGD